MKICIYLDFNFRIEEMKQKREENDQKIVEELKNKNEKHNKFLAKRQNKI